MNNKTARERLVVSENRKLETTKKEYSRCVSKLWLDFKDNSAISPKLYKYFDHCQNTVNYGYGIKSWIGDRKSIEMKNSRE